MILFDTNVLLDIATADPVWLLWSEKEFRVATAQGPILINPIIYAELAPAFATAADLDRAGFTGLKPIGIYTSLETPCFQGVSPSPPDEGRRRGLGRGGAFS